MSPLSVLITGGGRGVGRAAAAAFAARGHFVAIAGRDRAVLETTAAELGPDRVTAQPCDVSQEAEVRDLFAAVIAQRNRIDVVFNNAGLFSAAADPGETSFETWRRVMAVNLDGAFLVASAAFRAMKTQNPKGGRIINNGSISAHVPRPGSIPYTASKHAITGLTKSIALDGRPHNIACGQIDIGNAASDMTQQMPRGVPQPDGSLRPEPVMDADLVGAAVLAMAELPLEANILFQTIMATGMPYIGRG
ncbi:MAG: SDR family oxidoreductase [Pikeienuella sp.]